MRTAVRQTAEADAPAGSARYALVLQDCRRTQHRLHDNILDLAAILPPHGLGRAPFLQPRPDEPIRRMDGIQCRYASV